MPKPSTTRIVIFEPDEEQLKNALVGRELSPALLEFLKNLLQRKKWARKINIPSGQTEVAAVLVFSTTLKEGGLEIFSELHVFFRGRTMVEKWRVVAEAERIALLPKEVFRAIDIEKVRVDGTSVHVEFNVPRPGGQSSSVTKSFDFSVEDSGVRIVAHPLLDLSLFDADDQPAAPVTMGCAEELRP